MQMDAAVLREGCAGIQKHPGKILSILLNAYLADLLPKIRVFQMLRYFPVSVLLGDKHRAHGGPGSRVRIYIAVDIAALCVGLFDHRQGGLHLAVIAFFRRLMMGDHTPGAGSLHDGDKLLHRFYHMICLVTDVGRDHTALFLCHLCKFDQLLGGCVAAGSVNKAKGYAHSAGIHAVTQKVFHLFHFFAGCRPLLHAYHCSAQRIVAYEGGNVCPLGNFADLIHKFAHFYDPAVLPGRIKRRAALSADAGGNALLHLFDLLGELEHGIIRMAVRIDKSRCHYQTGSIQDFPGLP